MNTNQLENELKASFSSCVYIESQRTFRCERVFNGRTRATYFFAEADEPPSRERLDGLTSELISSSYFLAQDSARWSQYLVFVAPDSMKSNQAFLLSKRQVESDRAYARKFLICDSDLKPFLDTSVSKVGEQASRTDIVSTWTSLLAAAGLADIATSSPRAPIIRSVRDGTNQPDLTTSLLANPSIEPQEQTSPRNGFLEEFVISKFGTRKIVGPFKFGAVNLIRGPNGSGKTSLLEAIEHYFCGSSLRSAESPELLEARASFPGRPLVPFHVLAGKDAQARDLRWYGKTFSKGNHLPEGFARYNFLNTDAAVDFSRSEDLKDLQTALSKISLGPQAAFVWDRLGQFEQDLASAVSPAATAIARVDSGLMVARARLGALSQPSPLLAAQLRKFLAGASQLGYTFSDEGIPDINAEWLVHFSSLSDFANKIDRFASCASISEVIRRRTNLETAKTELQAITHRSAKLATEREQGIAQKAAIASQREALLAAERYLKSGISELVLAQREKALELRDITASPVGLADFDLVFGMESGLSSSVLVEQLGETLREEQRILQTELTSAEVRLAATSQSVTESAALLSSIRALGAQFAESHGELSACPLCNTSMSHADFVGRLAGLIGEEDNKHLALLHEQRERASSQLSAVNGRLAVINRLFQWRSDVSGLDLIGLRRLIEATAVRIEEGLAHEANIAQSLKRLEESGFTSQAFSLLEATLRAQSLLAADQSLSNESIADSLRLIASTEAVIDESLKNYEQGLGDEAANVARIAEQFPGTPNAELLSRISDEILSAISFLDAFSNLPDDARRLLDENLGAQAANVISVSKLLGELNVEFQTERGKRSELMLIQEQIAREEVEKQRLSEQHDRLYHALSTVRHIQEKHSLEASMSDFLTENLQSIQRIFEKIHLPKELKLSNLANCNLERDGQFGSVQLNQISTGQRAALVLSVFFTLNLTLRSGPPLMLIDDPVAHVDDLNTLSFLDFVADIAVSRTRQIFFATASEKLANLFSKKMEFLGGDFQTVDLRPAMSD